MRKSIWFIYLSILMLFAFGCSASDSDSTEFDRAPDSSAGAIESPDMGRGEDAIDQIGTDPVNLEQVNRKIIYNAHLDLEVKKYPDVIDLLENTVMEMNGYIVTNQTSKLENELHYGHIRLRIPQELLDRFFTLLESSELISIRNREVVGEDVTEDYIDLETRLRSREELEARLMAFMGDAETTEDLINISRDLANVQYEIERLKGQINHIDNRAELATVDLSMIERQTEFAHEQNFDVWERIQESWLASYNLILVTATNIFVFIIGYLPIILALTIIGGLIFLGYRHHRKSD